MSTAGAGEPEAALEHKEPRSGADWIITICLLGPSCLFALFIGVHDAALAQDLGVRSSGVVLAALGVVLGYAIVVRLARRAGADAIGMFACLVVTVISSSLIAAKALGRYMDFVWPFVELMVFFTFLAASLWGALFLWRRQRKQDHPSLFREFPVLGSAVSLGAVLGLLQFWYTNVYLPSSAEPSLSIAPSIGTVGVRQTVGGSKVLVISRIDLDNTSGARVEVVGAAYFLYGTCVYGHSHVLTTGPAITAMEGGPPVTLGGQQARQLVGFGKLLRRGQLIDAGETVHQFAVAVLKPGSYDMASIAIYVLLARPTLHLGATTVTASKAGGPSEAPPPPPSGPCAHLKPGGRPNPFSSVAASLTYTSTIQDNSWLHLVTRGRQYLRIHYSTKTGIPPVVISVSRHQSQDSSPGYSDAMSSLYGATYDVARAGVVLPVAGAQRAPEAVSTRRRPSSPARARHS